MSAFYAILPLANLESLGHCRAFEGWEAADVEETVWIRAPGALGEAAQRLWQIIPFLERFEERENSLLFHPGHQVPCRKKPALDWLPLSERLGVIPPRFLLPGLPPAPAKVAPQRNSGAPREPALVLLEAGLWQEWALTAPLLRLAPLRFAVSADQRVCVRGRPLPPLAGTYFVETGEGMALAAGWDFPPHLKPPWLAAAFSLAKDDLALWQSDGSLEIIPAAAWVAVSRASVRASCDPYWQRKEIGRGGEPE